MVATGKCFENALRFLIKNPEGTLMHGTVYSGALNKRIRHAWVELPDGTLWDGQTEEYMDKDKMV